MNKAKKISLYCMAAIYVGAGINHFVNPVFYKNIMPPWLPWHYPLITISGVVEIVLGLLLLHRPIRKWAAWGIIVLLVAVLPANVQMMINYKHQQNPYLWLAILRLPIQLLLIWWAYQFSRNKNSY
ncbi:MAG: DoxX family protein [Chitinophagaceae bacterium]|jgi:uncharacterized membrane protein|nr:DoxX family protein [Chitinophagaceae bacterium]MBK7680400.1 DoxX family protein [Chitinophagaceae bacterium]MBK8301832.1 DoxX family protein [Chitinophagaceae bacterium]MBK9465856.1 DoxX family protein [Chitinophagaceae bacterium]MBK9661102.1 DoxX family protein [Chitinophagaceae bacterium]